MPHVPVVVEFDYTRQVHSVPADSETQIIYNAPEGTRLVSWGISYIEPTVSVAEALITLDSETGDSQFIGTLRNADPVNETATHWNFVLLKL